MFRPQGEISRSLGIGFSFEKRSTRLPANKSYAQTNSFATKMKSTYTFQENLRGTITSDRGHSVIVDQPNPQTGDPGAGASSFELCGMSLNGCIATVFLLLAKKMRIDIQSFTMEMDGDKSPETSTFGAITLQAHVKTSSDESKVRRCMNLAIETCPVGKLFTLAGIPHTLTLDVETVD